jgi:heterodisulfide reductase subunit A
MVQGSDLLLFGEQGEISKRIWSFFAAAIEASPTARPSATMLTTQMDTNDFFTEARTQASPG